MSEGGLYRLFAPIEGPARSVGPSRRESSLYLV